LKFFVLKLPSPPNSVTCDASFCKPPPRSNLSPPVSHVHVSVRYDLYSPQGNPLPARSIPPMCSCPGRSPEKLPPFSPTLPMFPHFTLPPQTCSPSHLVYRFLSLAIIAVRLILRVSDWLRCFAATSCTWLSNLFIPSPAPNVHNPEPSLHLPCPPSPIFSSFSRNVPPFTPNVLI